MLRINYHNEMNYIYDASRKGAKYQFGTKKAYKNHGEFLESVAKFYRGFDYEINPATSYDTGDDIPQLKASVKSSNASLGCIYGDTFEDILNTYFSKVYSKLWIFINDIDNEITEYHMNASEFKEFLITFGQLGKDSKTKLNKIRIKKVSSKMLKWLDEKC